MTIRKVGNQYCVFSQSTNKKLGCYPTHDEAVKRLKQVEYFKNKAMNYDNIFENFRVDNIESTEQKKIHTTGSIAGMENTKVLDNREHFPVITPAQAQSSLSRVMKLSKIPDWFSGSLDELKYIVYAGIKESHPTLNLKVSVPMSVALSDGQTPADLKEKDIKDPNDVVESKVKEVNRPTLAEIWDKTEATEQISLGQCLIDMLQTQQDNINDAIDLTNRLIESGLDGEEFQRLSSYLQQDVLNNLMQLGVTATSKQALINKLIGAKKPDPKAKVRNRGDAVFPAGSSKVKDNKDHFPINSEAQARNALARVHQYSSVPSWYSGSLKELVAAVVSHVKSKYPGIKIASEEKKK